MHKNWTWVRNQFDLVPHRVSFAGLAMTAHPKPVRKAIARTRRLLDSDPFPHLKATLHQAEDEACNAAGKYFCIDPTHVALTDGTTIGLALLYAGLIIGPDQHIVTTKHEFSGALSCLEFREKRQGTHLDQPMSLYTDAHDIKTASLEGTILANVKNETRVLALTWVYSNTGLKLPIRSIATKLHAINASRAPADKVLLCVDGVHGFGVENSSFDELGCDFFVAGCHKWVHGPRGTGIWCGKSDAWEQYLPVVPTSSRTDRGPGRQQSPGGVQSYEHRWALDEAFGFLTRIGKSDIEERIHRLATDCKRELQAFSRVRLVTPMEPEFSSGIVCFDIDGIDAQDAVDALAANGIIATTSSLDRASKNRHVRLAFSIFNTESEIERCLAVLKDLP